MPIPTLVFITGIELVITWIGMAAGAKTPFKVSSIPKGVPMRPTIYTVIEDVVAVDGGGGRAYRRALDERYEASPMFRQMLARVNMFWAIGCFVVGVTVTGAVLTVNKEVAFGIGVCFASTPFFCVTIG
jgi:hypothetical protein